MQDSLKTDFQSVKKFWIWTNFFLSDLNLNRNASYDKVRSPPVQISHHLPSIILFVMPLQHHYFSFLSRRYKILIHFWEVRLGGQMNRHNMLTCEFKPRKTRIIIPNLHSRGIKPKRVTNFHNLVPGQPSTLARANEVVGHQPKVRWH